jgi:hypothetical protein
MDYLKDLNCDLPLNFPQTFLPERRLIAKLLEFAAEDGQGNKVSIGEETGIPTGTSTGKVEPMIYYALGMGLITAHKKDAGIWKLGLTSLGRIVIQEDKFLSESQTLWGLHLMLCRRYTLSTPAEGIADAWFALFAEGGFRLGGEFTASSLQTFLTDRHGEKSYLQSLSGVVIRSYLKDSCLGHINVLQETPEEMIIRQKAPADRSFFPVYAAYFYLIWDELFCDDDQVSLDDFAEQSRLFTIMNWGDSLVSRWLTWMSDQGIIQVDRYTGSPVLLRLNNTEQIVAEIYSELI